jgi:hypothetical protein
MEIRMKIKLDGKSPNKQKERTLIVESDKDGIWLTIEPKNAKSISSGYSIHLTLSEFEKFRRHLEA